MAHNIFEREVGRLLRRIFPVAERHDDASRNKHGTYQVRRKPWDYYGCTRRGRLWVAEAKSTHQSHWFVSNVGLHQYLALTHVLYCQGLAYLLINWRREKRVGEAVWIPWEVFLRACQAHNWAKRGWQVDDFATVYWLHRLDNEWWPSVSWQKELDTL